MVRQRRPGVRIVALRGPGYDSGASGEVALDPVIIGDELPLPLELENLESGLFWFGMVGGMTARKNPMMALDAFAQLEESRTGFIVAGLLDSSVSGSIRAASAALREAGRQVIIVDRPLSNDEMNGVLAALDCVILPYSTHAPPSTMGKAAALGVRMVAAGSPELRIAFQTAKGRGPYGGAERGGVAHLYEGRHHPASAKTAY